MKLVRNLKRRRSVQALGLLGAVVLGALVALPSAHAEKPAAGSGSVWLIVSHKVENVDRWKAVFDSTAALKKSYGWKQSNVFSVDGDRNNVVVMEEFASIDRAKAFAASSELKTAMGKAGVAGPPEIRFVTMVAHSAP